MDEVYLVTGVTVFLGREVARQLISYTLQEFFAQAGGKDAVLIHCAGLVTVASEKEAGEGRVWKVNVDGTRNIVDSCERYRIPKMVYVRFVHVIECFGTYAVPGIGAWYLVPGSVFRNIRVPFFSARCNNHNVYREILIRSDCVVVASFKMLSLFKYPVAV